MISNNMTSVLAIALFATVVGALQIGIAEEGSNGKKKTQCAASREAVAAPFDPDEIRRPQPEATAERHAIERQQDSRHRAGL